MKLTVQGHYKMTIIRQESRLFQVTGILHVFYPKMPLFKKTKLIVSEIKVLWVYHTIMPENFSKKSKPYTFHTLF